VKFRRGHDETWQFAFSVNDNKSEIERVGIVANIQRAISLGFNACVTALKYFGVNFLMKEIYIQRKSVLLWTLN